jgi:hypothetical protein
VARYWRAGDPLRREAAISRERRDALLAFDHHTVVVDGVWGILLLYEADDRAIVVHHPAPRHLATEDQVRAAIRKHPTAPADVQRAIDGLSFG